VKAVVYRAYGGPEVLQLVDLPMPAPKGNEVLVKVHATTVTIGDTIMRSLRIPVPGWQRLAARIYLGLRAPKRSILGMELAGEIKAVGKDVTRFRQGDQVLASTLDVDFGGYAEYKCFPEDGMIATKPAGLSFGEAAALVGGGITALRCLRKASIRSGQTVLVYGASGAVGTSAVQLAKHHFGAEVTGVCSAANLELVRSLGADRVLDYTRHGFTLDPETYDVVFDAVGKLDHSRGKRALKKQGVYLNVLKDSGNGARMDDLLSVRELCEAGKIRPVIDRSYPMEQIVEAHRYVDSGHKRGNVVINVA
jgi:NADPH:quinone reductase-like Zn-dependent oxidoreductase